MENKSETARLVIRAAALAGIFALIFLLSKLPDYIERKAQEKTASNEVAVTIPEGLNVSQIGEILEKAGLFPKSDFESAARKEEGFLFPDTYRFYKNSNPGQVIARMRENFDKKIIPEILIEIKDQNKTLSDIIVMASLLEEEAKGAEDRKLVAGILWKRLKVGIGLQVDATLTYILGKASSELTEDDLKIDSLYNTYRYRGLPPAPISNPGMEAILAAMRPAASPYFYYLSDKDGKIHYARDFEEHKLNKFKYIR